MDLINPKPFTSRYVEHGIKYEPIAIQEYEKVMFTRKTPVKVFIAIKGGGRPTRLLPHAKMLLIPMKLFLSAG